MILLELEGHKNEIKEEMKPSTPIHWVPSNFYTQNPETEMVFLSFNMFVCPYRKKKYTNKNNKFGSTTNQNLKMENIKYLVCHCNKTKEHL